jgi:hypothetical protein
MQHYRINRGSIHEQFLASRAKIQIMGGGFANGKTAALCIKVLQLARDYPGANVLLARSTYPKLKDTLLREFFKWLPNGWQKSYTKAPSPTLELVNGTTINFRYVQQQGKQNASSSSNLLSATYDIIGVDQFDDPEFEYKDFTDLLGRLRGGSKYVGTDPSMPSAGPRWIICTLNPTRNWFYRELIKPYLEWKKTGRVPDRLAQQLATFGTHRVEDFIQLVQGSTRENAHNLGDDYLRTLEATYSDVLAARYIEGDWGAFQGLVYPDYDEVIHSVDEGSIRRWKFASKITRWIEAFDFGTRAPSCYLLGFQDSDYNVVFVDGHYESGMSPETTIGHIRRIRAAWNVPADTTTPIFADPATFRVTGGEYKTVGRSTAEIFRDGGLGVQFTRGNNDVKNGIIKVRAYLRPHARHPSPFTGLSPAPFLYFNRKLAFIDEEITDYYFNEADAADSEDERPQDTHDHAMDTIKYGLTDLPEIKVILPTVKRDYSHLTRWNEAPEDYSSHGDTHGRYA